MSEALPPGPRRCFHHLPRRRFIDRLVPCLAALLLIGAATMPAMAADAPPWRAQVLGAPVQAASVGELRSSILLALTDAYAADQGIGVSPQEVHAYLAEMRRFMAAKGTPLPDPAQEPEADRRTRVELARDYILQRKIDAALWRQYGGRIARQDGEPVPVDAYRRFLEAQAAAGRLVFAVPAQAEAFWAPFRAEAPQDVYPPGSPQAAHAFDVPGAPAPARPGLQPFDRSLSLNGIGFRIASANEGSINRVVIAPTGLPGAQAPITREVDGTVTGAEVADLNGDGQPELYVYARSAGSGSYGSLLAFGVRGRQTLVEIDLPPIGDDVQASQGYMGHDAFWISGERLVRQFPLYRATDGNAQPTGGSREIRYRLVDSATGWVLRRDTMRDGP